MVFFQLFSRRKEQKLFQDIRNIIYKDSYSHTSIAYRLEVLGNIIILYKRLEFRIILIIMGNSSRKYLIHITQIQHFDNKR